MTSPLDGILVLDVTHWQQGPQASAMLADMGADVVKIEGPDSRDPGRVFMYRRDTRSSAYFQTHNRGKRSLAVDLKHPRGKETFLRLIPDTDVLLHNYRVGAMERLGLGYDDLRKINSRIIYVHATGYGKEGPEAGLGSFDLLAQARGGIMTVTGEPDDPPLPVSVPQADQVGAFMTAYGAVLALLHRERTGEGQEVTTSLLGTQLALQAFNITSYLMTRRLPRRSPRGSFGPTWTTYRCADDRYIALAMLENRYWPGICEALGRPDLLEDPRFENQATRARNTRDLVLTLDEVFATKPASEWLKRFRELDLLAELVANYEDVSNDPQVQANGYIEEIEQPGGEPLRTVGVPVQLSKTPGYVHGRAPHLGEHSRKVLLEHGFSEQEIAELAAERIIEVNEEPEEADP